MFYGASTACFYPLETEKSLKKICSLGIKNTEIFFNTYSELRPDYLKELKKIADDSGVNIRAVHPFTSFAENFILFTSYERRFNDSREFYKKYYDVSNTLGADIVVLHGAKPFRSVEDDEKFERFGIMSLDAKAQGVRLAQENVVDFSSGYPDYLFRMSDYLGDNFKMVLDIKQAKRSGYDAMLLVDKLCKSIIHVHASDNTKEFDCLPPGKGDYDLKKLKYTMTENGYDGGFIVELYNNNYKEDCEIPESVSYLEKL